MDRLGVSDDLHDRQIDAFTHHKVLLPIGRIGKEFDNFDYHDKLEGINYLEDKLMNHGVPPVVVNHFITQVKNDWL